MSVSGGCQEMGVKPSGRFPVPSAMQMRKLLRLPPVYCLCLGALCTAADDWTDKRNALNRQVDLAIQAQSEQVTAESICRARNLPFPIPEPDVAASQLKRLIDDAVSRAADLEFPPSALDEVRKEAEELFAVIKPGDTITVKTGGRSVTGRVVKTSPLVVAGVNIPAADQDEVLRARLNETLATQKKDEYVERKTRAYQNRRSAFENTKRAEIATKEARAHGYYLDQASGVLHPLKTLVDNAVTQARRRVLDDPTLREQTELEVFRAAGFVSENGQWMPKEVAEAQRAERRAAMDKVRAARLASMGKAVNEAKESSADAPSDDKDDLSKTAAFAELLHSAVVLCGSKTSAGSGFIVDMGGQTYLVTNQHVLFASQGMTFKTPSGVVLRPKSLEVAANLDLARMAIEGPGDLAEMFFLSPSLPGIGEVAYVLGNSGGGGVVTAAKGAVRGVGQDRIEVDAEFIQGNSGGPIVDAKGDVVGVATYLTRDDVDWTNENTRYTEVRRFGLRLEGVTRWVSTDANTFLAQSFLIEDSKMYLSDLVGIVLWDADFMRSYDVATNGQGYHDKRWPTRIHGLINEGRLLQAVDDRAHDLPQLLATVRYIGEKIAEDATRLRQKLTSVRWLSSHLADEANANLKLLGRIVEFNHAETVKYSKLVSDAIKKDQDAARERNR